MDHKRFFEDFGGVRVQHGIPGFCASYTTEMLYQTIKSRLIEELRCPPETGFAFLAGPQRLIDSTKEQGDG